MDLSHRIIAMVEGVPVKVECQTCGSHHKFRRPKSEPSSVEKKPRKATTSSRNVDVTKRKTHNVSEHADEIARVKEWQSRVAGQMAISFVRYSPQGTFEADSLVHHAKFGDGYVVQVIDANKIEVMFEHGAKVLAQGL